MGDIKEPHREGRRGAWWDAGPDKTDQDPLKITNGAFPLLCMLEHLDSILVQFLK